VWTGCRPFHVRAGSYGREGELVAAKDKVLLVDRSEPSGLLVKERAKALIGRVLPWRIIKLVMIDNIQDLFNLECCVEVEAAHLALTREGP